jgi:hypothetical protein
MIFKIIIFTIQTLPQRYFIEGLIRYFNALTVNIVNGFDIISDDLLSLKKVMN